MSNTANAGSIALVVADDYEDSELDVPVETLEKAGYRCDILGDEEGRQLRGKRGGAAVVSKAVADARADEYAALVIPGGYSPDHLRTNPAMVDFVKDFFAQNKPVAAICHGPQLLIEADAVRGRRVTSWPSVRTDLINAGAHWLDREVVIDGNLITSRKPADLEAFGAALLDKLAAF